MATTRLMPLHVGDGRTAKTAIKDIIDYVENPASSSLPRINATADVRTQSSCLQSNYIR